jgi:hypothetical protein
MVRRDSSAVGCGLGLTFLAPLLCGVMVGVPTFILTAPVVAAYLLIRNPAQFEPERFEWLVAAAAAPLLAFALVRLASPRSGRLRGPKGKAADGAHQPTGGRSRQRAILTGYLLRAGFLLAATSVTAVMTLLRNNDDSASDAAQQNLAVGFSPAIAGAAVLVIIRLLDRQPITIETVRAATEQATRALSQVRAENERVSRLAQRVEAKLRAARFDTDFVALCDLHHESVGCADCAHGHYRSAKTSLQTMARILVRIRFSSRRWFPQVHHPAAVSRAHRDRVEMAAAASMLAVTRGQLDVEVERGLNLVRTLNNNTHDLKQSIKDNCGERGRRWHQDLEQRIKLARDRERQYAR